MPTAPPLILANHRAWLEVSRKDLSQPARSMFLRTKLLRIQQCFEAMFKNLTNLKNATPRPQRLAQPLCFSDPTILQAIPTAISTRDKSTTSTRGIRMILYVRLNMSKICTHCSASEKVRHPFAPSIWKINLTSMKGCAPFLSIGSSKFI